MAHILVTNCLDSGEDVLVINTTLRASEIEKAFKLKKANFEECYEIADNEIQYYCYDPLFASEKFDNRVRRLIYPNHSK